MSRGFGRIQRAVLQVLDTADRSMDTLEIAGRVHRSLYGDPDFEPLTISIAFYESVRRALKSLERKGLVCGLWRLYRGGKAWANRTRALEEADSLVRILGTSSLRSNKPLFDMYTAEARLRSQTDPESAKP